MERENSLRKIKVMFIIDFIYGSTGGTENQLIKLINNLDQGKYDLHLLSLRDTPWIRENRRTLNCRTQTYHIVKLKNPANFLTVLRVTRYIKQLEPDIVLTFFPVSNVLGVIAARLAGVDVIISTRRDYGLWIDKRSIYFLRFANRFVKGIVTNSHSVKELTSSEEKFDKSKIDVVYNGIEVDSFEPRKTKGQLLKKELGISPHNKVVGIVANLNPMKRHRAFIKAASRVLQRRSNVDFVIVGDGPLRQDLVALTAELGIKEYVRFVGSQEDIRPFLAIFDIAVNCSANEGLSNAIMEYMACGVPCIVARAGGNEELIENGVNGYTFELNNDDKLAQLIIALLDDKMKQKEFALKSREKILNELTLNRMIMEYDKYFTQLLRVT